MMVDNESHPPLASDVARRGKWGRVFRWGLGLLLISGIAIQFVPVEISNPPVTGDIPTSPEVKVILRKSCYDCHSNETVWPWYSYVAPVSWLVAGDVREGRKHLNFSTWDRYDAGKQAHKIHEVWEEVDEGEMPLWFYTPLHPEANLSAEDLATLKAWVQATPEVRRDRGRRNDDSDDE